MAVCGTGAPLLTEIWSGFMPAMRRLTAIRLSRGHGAQDMDWLNLPPPEPLYLRPPDATLPDPEKRIKWRGARPA